MNTKKSTPAAKKDTSPIEPWERERMLEWLALTGNVRRTALQVKRSPATVWKVMKANEAEILTLRASLSQNLRQTFDATIRVLQEKIQEMVGWLEKGNPENASLAEALFDLSKCVAIQTERRQVLAELPGTISRQEGQEDSKAQRDTDREYLRSLMRDIDREGLGFGGLGQDDGDDEDNDHRKGGK